MFWKINSRENWGEVERCVALFIYTTMLINTHKYSHGEMRNKKLINRGNDITQGCSSAVLNKSPWKKKGKKRKKNYYNTGYSYLVTQPSTNHAQQGLTFLSGWSMLLSFWYSNSTLNAFLKFLRWTKVSKREKNLWYCMAGKVVDKNIRGIWKWELLLALVIRQAALSLTLPWSLGWKESVSKREKNLWYCMAGKEENNKIEGYENGNNYLLWFSDK